MTDFQKKKIDNCPHGFTHYSTDKETNENVMGWKKSQYGNEYNGSVHPDFLASHADVLHIHEKNQSHSWVKGGDTEGKAAHLHNKVYSRYFNDGGHTTYKHAGSKSYRDSDGKDQEIHTYDIHDPDGDKVISFDSKRGPDKFTGDISKVHSLNTNKYDKDIHYEPAKVKHGIWDVERLLSTAAHMHKNKDAKAPRFVGHKSDPIKHKSFKTRLPQGDAIKAYVSHLKSKGEITPEHINPHSSDHHSVFVGPKSTHTITHVGDVLSHYVHDHGKYSDSKAHSQIIESKQA